jgi:hypothetical protein
MESDAGHPDPSAEGQNQETLHVGALPDRPAPSPVWDAGGTPTPRE